MKIDMILSNVVELIGEDTNALQNDEAFAAISLNPLVTWVKFVLTDDKPNGNKQRIPQSEFANLIKSGVFMPIKMALGSINEGHDASLPIGVITHLKEAGDQVRGIGALWSKERPEDVDYIRQEFSSNRPLNLSWEIVYESDNTTQDGITELVNTALRAITLVGMPAYEGRTPILAVASKWTAAYIDSLSDSCFLFIESGGEKNGDGKTKPRSLRHLPYKDTEGHVDPAHLRNAIPRAPQIKLANGEMISEAKASEIQKRAQKLLSRQEDSKLDELEILQAKVLQFTAEIDAAKLALTAKENELLAKAAELETLTTEVAGLREYKATAEKAEAEKVKLASIKQKFTDAGIEKPDTYFDENRAHFLQISEGDLDFVIQELVSFAKSAKSAIIDPNLPKIDAEEDGSGAKTSEIAEALRKLREKKS
jgi:hypothetical protein